MGEILEQFTWWSALDIIIVSFVIYQIMMLVRGTRAGQMLIGMMVIIILYIASSIFPLTTLHWTMSRFYSSFIFIIIVLFQDDIRSVLSRIGKKSFLNTGEIISTGRILDELTRAATSLAQSSTGALIVLERNIILSRYVDIGITLDAKISKEILLATFHTSSPIHDGAVIIQKGRIAAAGCFLPLTKDEDVNANLGTRHRAALGISQETDAIVILVSEEDSSVSIAIDGRFNDNLDAKTLRKQLQKYLVQDNPEADQQKPMPGKRKNDSILSKVIYKASKALDKIPKKRSR